MTPEPWGHWISTERVVELHREALNRHGGTEGPSDDIARGMVAGHLGAALNAVGYSPSGDEGLQFAGCVLFYMIRGHSFADGNKRVGWMVAIEALGRGGYGIMCSDDEARQFVESVAAGTLGSPNDVIEWLANHVGLHTD